MKYAQLTAVILNLTDHRLRRLYDDIAKELNRRDGITFPRVAAE